MRRAVFPPAIRLPDAAAGVVLALFVLLVLSTAGLAAPSAAPPTRSPLVPAAGDACADAGTSSPATGSLVLVGNASPLPSVSGVPVHIDYFYTEVEKVDNNSTESCVATSASGATDAAGSFSIALPVPADRCVTPVCVEYQGPFGPLGYATPGAPEGFIERDPQGATSPVTIEWLADLYTAKLNVTGLDVVSTNAPVALSATAWNALGEPASTPLAYSWNLAGLEWGISSESGPNVTVAGTDSGWTGSLSVTVEATYGSTTESVPSAVLSLLPVPTTVRSATASPTPVDPGVPVTFYVTGSGAAGYAYSATVDPGLGAGSVTGACESTSLPNGTANLTCGVQAAYPTAGTAFPVASISNGYSAGQISFGPVPVHPVEQVALNAPTLVTYPNRPIELTVSVANGTGSAPYGPVCLSIEGVSALTCASQNTTKWTFNATFAATGEYGLRASVVDRFGENVSASAVVVVVSFLTARTNGSSSITLFANQTTALSVVVAGGALPLTAWWNVSGSSAYTCGGSLDFDGTISCPYPTSLPGVTNLTVTLRDALGSEVAVVFRITVTTLPVPPDRPGGFGLAASSDWILFGVLTALAVGVLLVAWDVRRRLRTPSPETDGDGVAENELERMARGRDHLLAQADPRT
ncbi:MAG: hypothetical protein WA688_08900, partial [Thermoplasmata archaeon]